MLGNVGTILLRVVVLCVLCLVGCNRNSYECIERTEREVPNFFGKPGTHTTVDYVLLHSGHKIYATCDFETINNLDPKAGCGLRPLRNYYCTMSQNGKALSDLRCIDANGGNVYLYVSKKE